MFSLMHIMCITRELKKQVQEEDRYFSLFLKRNKFIYYYHITQLVAANWRIDLDTWIFVKTFQVSAFASPSLVLASSKHIQRVCFILHYIPTVTVKNRIWIKA